MPESEGHPLGEIQQDVTAAKVAAISATGDSTVINNTITNYFGSGPPVPMASPGRGCIVDPAAAERLRKAELLPHLPNRGPQDTELNRALKQHLSDEQARPIIVIAYGEEHQALERYFDRFLEVNLPEVLPEFWDGTPERYDLRWGQITIRREFDDFFDSLVRQCLPGDLQLNKDPRPHNRLIVLRSDLNSDDWGRRNGAELMSRICRYWTEGRQWEGWRIIHWIGIKLLRGGSFDQRGLRPRWLRKQYWDHRNRCRRKALYAEQIRAYFHESKFADLAPPVTVVLEELQSVRRSCAETWANSVKVQRVVPAWAIEALREELVRFYADQENRFGIEEVPMQDLAAYIKALLDRLHGSLDRAELTR